MSQELIDAAWAPNDAFNRGDWDAFSAALAPDAMYEEITTGRIVNGPDANVELAKGWKSAFPNVRATVNDTHVSGNTVIFEVTWNGTQDGPLPMPDGTALPPSGKSVAVRAMLVTMVEGGKVTKTRHYLDMLGMLTQHGVIPS